MPSRKDTNLAKYGRNKGKRNDVKLVVLALVVYYLKVESHAKELKERSMNEQFRSRFEAELHKIADSLTKKGGVKQEDKVHQRIGRVKYKYAPLVKRKSVVQKSELENCQFIEQQHLHSD